MNSQNPNTPAMNQKELDRKMDAVTKCGANRGPHDYVPLSWSITPTAKHVTHMICRICFTRVSTRTLFDNFPEAKL